MSTTMAEQIVLTDQQRQDANRLYNQCEACRNYVDANSETGGNGKPSVTPSLALEFLELHNNGHQAPVELAEPEPLLDEPASVSMSPPSAASNGGQLELYAGEVPPLGSYLPHHAIQAATEDSVPFCEGRLIFGANPSESDQLALSPEDLRFMMMMVVRRPDGWLEQVQATVRKGLLGMNDVVTETDFAPRKFYLLQETDDTQTVFEPVVLEAEYQRRYDQFVLKARVESLTRYVRRRGRNGSFRETGVTRFSDDFQYIVLIFVNPETADCKLVLTDQEWAPPATAE